jgi:hypothetical protein
MDAIHFWLKHKVERKYKIIAATYDLFNAKVKTDEPEVEDAETAEMSLHQCPAESETAETDV